ncbi:hypothetical protein B0J13DRAFT_564267 [Dactylonectria estremocensis]|uniref:Acetylesterase n=1 Tax=Dactylonectria estremocensis TaxID=1079267 RepID=A0A9P9E1Y3_9HYPO|nr:hypothetical protein B0J13DRAFT_564267 [Dactylonectria estremocensis]
MTPKFLVAALAGALLQTSSVLSASPPKYLITFGDSYSQTWFDIHGEAPSAANPIGNPPFPGWTASGGVNWVGSLAAEFNKSLTLAYNFAYGGATVDSEIVPPYTDTVVSMEGQVNIFLDFIHNQSHNVPWKTSNALVGVWMGVNDVGNSFYLENADDIVKRTVARYFELLQKVYNAGIRKFVLLSVPPTNLTPLMLQQDSDSSARLVSAIKLYNKLLSVGFQTFQKRNRHITGKIIDTSLAFNRAIKNPTKYGAPNATCYNEDGLSCLWFNDYHPGITIERLVASDVGAEVNSRKFAW